MRNITRLRVILCGLLVVISSAGCAPSRYAVVGNFDNHNEMLLGDVENNILTGSAKIKVEGQKSHMKCAGDAVVTEAPLNLFGCADQKGKADLVCDDGRTIKATYTTLSCSQGVGSGLDQYGNKFSFTFGMPKSEALVILDQSRTTSDQKPDLPLTPNQKKARAILSGPSF